MAHQKVPIYLRFEYNPLYNPTNPGFECSVDMVNIPLFTGFQTCQVVLSVGYIMTGSPYFMARPGSISSPIYPTTPGTLDGSEIRRSAVNTYVRIPMFTSVLYIRSGGVVT